MIKRLSNQVEVQYLHVSDFTLCCYFFPASQMWLLGRLLPLMVGVQVPDGDSHWLCFMELLMIAVLSTAVEVTDDTAHGLMVIIESYLFHFNKLYPDSMTPKMHYLLHLPEQMRQ